MVQHVFDVIGQAVSQFISVLTSGITNATAILYDSTNGFTFVGTMLLIAVGISVVYWIFRLLRGITSGVAR